MTKEINFWKIIGIMAIVTLFTFASLGCYLFISAIFDSVKNTEKDVKIEQVCYNKTENIGKEYVRTDSITKDYCGIYYISLFRTGNYIYDSPINVEEGNILCYNITGIMAVEPHLIEAYSLCSSYCIFEYNEEGRLYNVIINKTNFSITTEEPIYNLINVTRLVCENRSIEQ